MFRRTFTWEAKWTYAGLRFQTSVKTSSVHMKLHFKTTRYFDGHVQAHFISGSVYMIFYRPKWNFISLKMANMKSVPVLSFKGTCVLNATSKSLRLSISFGKIMFTWKFHAGFKFHFCQNNRYEIHTVLSFISAQFNWTHVKSWLLGAASAVLKNSYIPRKTSVAEA